MTKGYQLIFPILLISSQIFSQIPKDSTVYNYYINQSSVDSVYYNLEYFKNGNVKEKGWKIRIDNNHDLEEIPNELTPGEVYTDIKVGEYNEYYKNGKLKVKRLTELNKTDSIYVIIYDKTGGFESEIWFPHKKLCSCNRTEDKKYASYRKNYKKGSIESNGHILIFSFKKVDWWTYYDTYGNIRLRELYEDGRIIQKQLFDEKSPGK